MALQVKIASCFGVPEYWSIGVLGKAKALISIRIGPFITPLLNHSITPADYRKGGKTVEAPSGGSSKRGPLGTHYLLEVFSKSNS